MLFSRSFLVGPDARSGPCRLRGWRQLRLEQRAGAAQLPARGESIVVLAATRSSAELLTATDAEARAVRSAERLKRLLYQDILTDRLGQVKLVIGVDTRLVGIG